MRQLRRKSIYILLLTTTLILNYSCKNRYYEAQLQQYKKNRILSLNFDNNTSDLSGNNNGLTPQRISYTKDFLRKKYCAAYFDGENSSIISNDNDLYDLKSSFTFSAWIKPETNKAYIIQKKMDYNGGGPYSFDFFPGKLRIILYFSPSDYFVLEGNSPIVTNTWQYVAATWDGNSVRLYLNGKLDKESILTQKSILNSSKPLGIGLYQWNPTRFSFKGAMDNLEIYNVALPQSVIETKYKKYK